MPKRRVILLASCLLLTQVGCGSKLVKFEPGGFVQSDLFPKTAHQMMRWKKRSADNQCPRGTDARYSSEAVEHPTVTDNLTGPGEYHRYDLNCIPQ